MFERGQGNVCSVEVWAHQLLFSATSKSCRFSAVQLSLSLYETIGSITFLLFNTLNLGHATTSVEDEKWVEAIFAQIFDGKSPEQVNYLDTRPWLPSP